MRNAISVLALFALAAVVPAQAGKGQAATAKAEYDKLVAEWKAESKTAQDAVKSVMESEAYKAAAAAKDSAKMRELTGAVKRPDPKAYGQRALKGADQFGNDGLQFLIYAANNFPGSAADKSTAEGIVERVSKRFLSNPKLVELLEQPNRLVGVVGTDAGNEFLAKVVSDSKDDQLKAWALYWQGTLLGRGKPTEEQQAKATELLAAAEKLAKGDLADRIAAPQFQKEHLQIGMEAPDIVGEDIDGVPFKLSDYRGKVVVIDFWGYW
jgi:hypothetical protein